MAANSPSLRHKEKTPGRESGPAWSYREVICRYTTCLIWQVSNFSLITKGFLSYFLPHHHRYSTYYITGHIFRWGHPTYITPDDLCILFLSQKIVPVCVAFWEVHPCIHRFAGCLYVCLSLFLLCSLPIYLMSYTHVNSGSKLWRHAFHKRRALLTQRHVCSTHSKRLWWNTRIKMHTFPALASSVILTIVNDLIGCERPFLLTKYTGRWKYWNGRYSR